MSSSGSVAVGFRLLVVVGSWGSSSGDGGTSGRFIFSESSSQNLFPFFSSRPGRLKDASPEECRLKKRSHFHFYYVSVEDKLFPALVNAFQEFVLDFLDDVDHENKVLPR